MAIACGSFAFTACDDDDDNRIAPDSVVTKAFDSLYPNAQRVSWEYEDGFVKAEFYTGRYESEAWFDHQGNWFLTETDIPYESLPEAVKSSFESGTYANWRIEDVDMLERPETGTVYVIDVESGERDVDLRYMDNGTLINEGNTGNTGDENRPSTVPSSIREAVLSLYPGATIFEIDTDRNGTEVDIWHDNLHKEVRFDTNDQWLYTEWDIRRTEIPSVVLSAFNASEYASYRIDDTNVIQKADGIYYEFELERGERDIILLFDEAGNIAPSTI